MKDTLISFKTAKLAKEKGFEIICPNGYHPNEGNLFSGNTWHSILKIKSDRHTQAPTQSLLQKWLREVHNIYVYITLGSEFIQIAEVYNKDGERVYISDFNTYEDALEKGLLQALKLIS